MELERRLSDLARELAVHTSSTIVAEFLDLVRAGEYGVALEILCDRLDDAQQPLTRPEITTIRRLAREMNLDRPSIDFIDELEVTDS